MTEYNPSRIVISRKKATIVSYESNKALAELKPLVPNTSPIVGFNKRKKPLLRPLREESKDTQEPPFRALKDP